MWSTVMVVKIVNGQCIVSAHTADTSQSLTVSVHFLSFKPGLRVTFIYSITKE